MRKKFTDGVKNLFRKDKGTSPDDMGTQVEGIPDTAKEEDQEKKPNLWERLKKALGLGKKEEGHGEEKEQDVSAEKAAKKEAKKSMSLDQRIEAKANKEADKAAKKANSKWRHPFTGDTERMANANKARHDTYDKVKTDLRQKAGLETGQEKQGEKGQGEKPKKDNYVRNETAKGAAKGAAAGALFGAMVGGPIGALAGAIIGALIGSAVDGMKAHSNASRFEKEMKAQQTPEPIDQVNQIVQQQAKAIAKLTDTVASLGSKLRNQSQGEMKSVPPGQDTLRDPTLAANPSLAEGAQRRQ